MTDAGTVAVVDDFCVPGVVEAVFAGTPFRVRRLPSVPGPDDVPDLVALLVGPEQTVAPQRLSSFPALRVVAATSSGTDHVPLGVARERGLWVTSAAGYCTEEVADHALALGLALLRGVAVYDRDVHAGGWNPSAARPRRVAGTRWGLVGTGRIAQALAARTQALGMPTRGWHPDPAALDRACAAAGLRPAATLTDLLAGSDVVSLHLPLSPATHGILGAAGLAAMPAGSFLVNVGRGQLLDHDALAAALASGHLAGAALDVLPAEPPSADDVVLGLPRTILTPHVAWLSEEAERLAFRWAAESALAVLQGRRPPHVVVLEPAP